MTHTVLIIEDHPAMRAMLQAFLSEMTQVEVIGAVSSAEEALRFCDQREPDLALVDVSLPGKNGIDLVADLRAGHPQVRCLMLSGHQEPSYIERALANGARGFLLKGDPDEMLSGIECVLGGERYLSHAVREKLRLHGEHG